MSNTSYFLLFLHLLKLFGQQCNTQSIPVIFHTNSLYLLKFNTLQLLRDFTLNTSTEFIKSYLVLKKAARRNSPNFTEQLCEFITTEFQLYSTMLLKVLDGNQFRLLGKSSATKSSFRNNDILVCANCENRKDDAISGQLSVNSHCEIKTTDFTIYEGCCLIRVTADVAYMLKVSKKSPFSESDKEAFTVISDITQEILEIWSGKISSAGKTFSEYIYALEEVFQAPIKQIAGSYALLKSENLSEVAKDHLNSIRKNNRILQAMQSDLTELAGIETGRIKPEMQKTDLKSSLEKVLSSFSTMKESEIEVKYKEIPSHYFSTDKKIFQHIVSDVLSFLLDKTNKIVSVSVLTDSNKNIQINLRNEGLFLSLSELQQCRSGDFIGNYDPENASIGSPLSLRLAWEYAKLCNISLEFSSNQANGTNIQLLIHVSKSDEIKDAASIPNEDVKNKILMVVDDYAVSKFMNSVFKQFGYEVKTINSGNKALFLLQEESFRMVFVDVVLPDISAPEFILQVRSISSAINTPIVIAKMNEEENKIFFKNNFEFMNEGDFQSKVETKLESFKALGFSNVMCYGFDNEYNVNSDLVSSFGMNMKNYDSVGKLFDEVELGKKCIVLLRVDNQEEIFNSLKNLHIEISKSIAILLVCKENISDLCLSHFNSMFDDHLQQLGVSKEQVPLVIQEMLSLEAPAKETDEAPEEKNPNILLVEDYKHSQIIVTRLLKKNGFPNITIKENGAQAIEEVTQKKYDLILMDMQMPVMNGFIATEKIREMDEYKQTPIIALTAFAMKGDKEKCINAGATDYIPKPIDSADFIEKVKHYTGKQ